MAFNEDTRVKIPASIHFLRLGYKYQSLKDADIDFQTKIFINRFKPAVEKINGREFSFDEIKALLQEINRVISNNDMGKEFYNWLIKPNDRVRLIDFDDISNNDFAIVDELPFSIVEDSEKGSFRPDINILINGIPLAFLEVKHPDNSGGIQAEFERMLNKRLVNPDYRKFFNMIQATCFSNNMEYEDTDDAEDVKAGSFYTTPNGQKTSFSFFREYDEQFLLQYQFETVTEETCRYILKDCGYSPDEYDTPEFQENLQVTRPCNSFVTSFFDHERFMFILRYGLIYVNSMPPEKHIMRYPQFFAVREIIKRFESGGKNGIIWHTQGSGKTALTAFAYRVIHDYYSVKNVSTRVFFIVDRLDLLRQASLEFKARGFYVINCKDKDELTHQINAPLPKDIPSDATGVICVANIQKLESEMEAAKNDYDVQVQRVFFIDEAHRSYKRKGTFFTNLMTCDEDAHYIALTGTPLLTKKERSNKKFGDYIHTYFYDASIADGYTLRIKKENIDTIEKSAIRKNLDIEDGRLNDKDVYESDAYVNELCKFIERDFENFRFVNADNTIGGMIVCRSNPQAAKVQKWFEQNSKFKTGLVMNDSSNPAQAEINKNNQIDFHDSLTPDILVVHYMLTTGYDVKRLKKMYLLRGPHAQSLLQTISRVNRPYKSPTGKVYKYGYICDFIDIEEEYNRTLEAYIKELEEELNENGENEGSLTSLVVDKEVINEKYLRYKAELESYVDTSNLERFSTLLTMFNKEALLKIRRLLNGIKDCRTEFVLSRAKDYAAQIDIERINRLLNLVQNRIDFINLQSRPVSMMDIISNEEVVEILYQFIKTRIMILDLGKFTPSDPDVEEFVRTVQEVQNELKKNRNKGDIKIEKLDKILQEIFDKMDIHNISELTEELKRALEEARNINAENARIAAEYGGHYAFVRSYQDAIINVPVDKSVIESFLKNVYDQIKDIIDTDSLIIQGKSSFIASIKRNITKDLVKQGIYKAIKVYYDQLLAELYVNVQLYR